MDMQITFDYDLFCNVLLKPATEP